MKDSFEEIRQQMHDFRSYIDVRLAGLDYQLAHMRVLMDQQFGGIDSRLAAHTFKLKEQKAEIGALSERLEQLELALNATPVPLGEEPLPLLSPNNLVTAWPVADLFCVKSHSGFMAQYY